MLSFLIRFAFRLLKAFLAFILLLALAWFFREPLLRGAARVWVVDSPVAHADAIVVLGGGKDWRPFAAANLYLSGNAPTVLVFRPAILPAQDLLNQQGDAEVNTAILLKKGVPADAIQLVGQGVLSTRDEAMAVREWVISNQAKNIIIPTDPLHTRRARWIFERALISTGATAHVQSASHPAYVADTWWKTEEGFLAFNTEILKSLYYFFRY